MPHFLWVIRQGQICAWRFFCALLVMKSNPDSTQIFTLLWGEVFCNYRNSYFSTQEKCIERWWLWQTTKNLIINIIYFLKYGSYVRKYVLNEGWVPWECWYMYHYFYLLPKMKQDWKCISARSRLKNLVAFQSHIFRSMRHLCIAHSIWKSPQKCNLSRNAVKWDILSNFQTIVLCGKCSCLRHKCHCIDPTTIV